MIRNPKSEIRDPDAITTVRLKKPHPCGGREFTVVRESVVVILKCNTCGSIVRMAKEKFDKAVPSTHPPSHKASADKVPGKENT